MVFFKFFFVILTVGTFSCQSSSKKNETQNTNQVVGSQQNQVSGVHWFGQSFSETWVFSQEVAVQSIYDCPVAYWPSQFKTAPLTERTWTISLRNSESAGGGQEIDLVAGRAKHTLRSPADVTNANVNSLFGYSDWVLGVAKDITDRNESGSRGSKLYKSGETIFTLILFERNRMYTAGGMLGLTYGASKAEDRPKVLDTHDYYLKENQDI